MDRRTFLQSWIAGSLGVAAGWTWKATSPSETPEVGVSLWALYRAPLFVDFQEGSDSSDGTSWTTALRTMGETLERVRQGGVIYFYGKTRESGLVTPRGAPDVRVVGVTPRPREGSDGRTGGPKGGGANWVSSSDENPEPLLTVTQQGWAFENIAFRSTPGGALRFVRNEAAEDEIADDPVERRAGDHALIKSCVFEGPGLGLAEIGGVVDIHIEGSLFFGFATPESCPIYGPLGGVGYPLHWAIRGNHFFGNFRNISIPELSDSVIWENVFQPESILFRGSPVFSQFIDSRNGVGNVVADNMFGVRYNDVSRHSTPGPFDAWFSNYYLDGPFTGFPSPERKVP